MKFDRKLFRKVSRVSDDRGFHQRFSLHPDYTDASEQAKHLLDVLQAHDIVRRLDTHGWRMVQDKYHFMHGVTSVEEHKDFLLTEHTVLLVLEGHKTLEFVVDSESWGFNTGDVILFNHEKPHELINNRGVYWACITQEVERTTSDILKLL